MEVKMHNTYYRTILIFLILCYSAPVYSYQAGEGWTWKDTAYESVFACLTIIDWGQTRYSSLHPEQYTETNPILGDHPSVTKVDVYFPAAIVGHALISAALPPKYRRWWQFFWIGAEGYTISNNARAGVRIEF